MKIYQAVNLRFVHYIICMLYFNKKFKNFFFLKKRNSAGMTGNI